MPETILPHLELRKDPAGRFLWKWGLGNRHKKPFFQADSLGGWVVYGAWMPEHLEGSQLYFSSS